MKAIIISLAILFTFLLSLICLDGSAQLLAKTFPYTSVSSQKVMCCAPTNDGGYIIATGGGTAALVKTDGDFNIQWAKSINPSYLTAMVSTSSSLKQVADGGYLLFYSGQYLAKFDAFGNGVWRTSYSAYDPGGYSIYRKCVEKSNGKIVTLETGYENFKVVQFSSDGMMEWAKTFTGGADVSKNPGFELLAMDDSTVIVSGKRDSDNCFARIDDNGVVLWSAVNVISGTYNHPRGMTLREDGNIMVAGLRGFDGFIMVISAANGHIIWQKEVLNLVFDDIKYIGNDQYALLAKTGSDLVMTTDDLALVIVDKNGELVSSRLLQEITDASDFPEFFSYNDRHFVSVISDPFGTSGGFSLLEFDSTLNFSCRGASLPFTKIATTLVPVFDGTLTCGDGWIFPTCSALSVPDVTLDLTVAEFCDIFPPIVEVYQNEVSNVFTNGSALITEISLDINQNQVEGSISIFPNPANQNSNITISFPVSDEYLMKLTDVSGKVIFTNKFVGNSSTLASQNMASGVYMLNIVSTSGKQFFRQKLMIE